MAQTIAILIDNQTGEALTRTPGATLDHGEWTPDGQEPSLNALSFSVNSCGFMTGCEGTVVYSGPSGSATLYFDNPYLGDNKYGATPGGSYKVAFAGAQGTHATVTYTITKPQSTPPPASSPVPDSAPMSSSSDPPTGTDSPSGDPPGFGHVPLCPSGVVLSQKTVYDRDAAVAYARKYALIPCSDGFVAVAGVPAYHEFAQSDLDKDLNKLGEKLSMDDCTHFVSCCIGFPTNAMEIGAPSSSRGAPSATSPRVKAGGLRIPPQGLGNAWIYGIASAPKLLAHLKGQGYGKVVFNPPDVKSRAYKSTNVRPPPGPSNHPWDRNGSV